MAASLKQKKRSIASGRPDGIPQPTGPERIKRKESVIWDSLGKRAIAGEPDAIRLCIDLKLIDPANFGKNNSLKERVRSASNK